MTNELAQAIRYETSGDYSKAMGIYIALGMFSSKYRDDIQRCQRKLSEQYKKDAHHGLA